MKTRNIALPLTLAVALLAPPIMAADPIVYAPPSLAGNVKVSGPQDFGGVYAGTKGAPQTITLAVIGTETLFQVFPSVSTADFLYKGSCGSPMPPGSRCDISVVFAPTATGPRKGALNFVVHTSAYDNGWVSVPLTGTGLIPPPAMPVIPPAVPPGKLPPVKRLP